MKKAVLAVVFAACSCAAPINYGTCDLNDAGDISGGKAMQHAEYAVELKMKTQAGDVRCSGTVIGQRAILTAKHCIIGDEIQVYDSEGGLLDVATKFAKHPNKKTDMALIFLTENIGLRPALLPTKPAMSLAGRFAVIVGYGVDYYSMERGLKVASVEIAGVKGSDVVIQESSQTVCFGDSGGALIYCGVVAGVLATGSTDMFGNCTVGMSFAADVYSQIDWIREQLK